VAGDGGWERGESCNEKMREVVDSVGRGSGVRGGGELGEVGKGGGGEGERGEAGGGEGGGGGEVNRKGNRRDRGGGEGSGGEGGEGRGGGG